MSVNAITFGNPKTVGNFDFPSVPYRTGSKSFHYRPTGNLWEIEVSKNFGVNAKTFGNFAFFLAFRRKNIWKRISPKKGLKKVRKSYLSKNFYKKIIKNTKISTAKITKLKVKCIYSRADIFTVLVTLIVYWISHSASVPTFVWKREKLEYKIHRNFHQHSLYYKRY